MTICKVTQTRLDSRPAMDDTADNRSLSANSVCWAETAVPPKRANETRLTKEFAKQKSQKHKTRRILSFWRRESGIRTTNLAGRISLKLPVNSVT
jgi:hypothetical protein